MKNKQNKKKEKTENASKPTTTTSIRSGQTEREWDKYFDLYIKHANEYAARGFPNKKFALLYEIGSFWELYGVENNKEKIGNIREVLEITNNILSQKNNSVGPDQFNPNYDPMMNDRDHPLFGGFPFSQQESAEAKLIEAGYDLIYYIQTGDVDPDTDKKIRKYERTVTPGSFIGELVDLNSCHLISIYINNVTKDSQPVFKWTDLNLCIGMTSVDLTTNEAIVYSVQSKDFDKMYSLNEVYRFLKSMNPKEIIICLGNCSVVVEVNDLNFPNYLRQELALHEYGNIVHIGLVDSKFSRTDYQEEIVKIVYAECKKSHNPFDIIRLADETDIRVSLVQLFDYVYQTNPDMLKHIKKPTVWTAVDHFTLTNNAIVQLEIDFPAQKNTEKQSLLNILDKTSTSMGKRLFRTTLLNPIISTKKLEHRWNLIDTLRTDNRWKAVEEHLRGIQDLTKLYKRLSVKRLYPCELVSVHNSHGIVKKLFDMLKSVEWGDEFMFLLDDDDLELFAQFIAYVDSTFDLSVLTEYHLHDINRSLFKKGKYPDIDKIQNSIDRASVSLDEFYDTICGLCVLDAKTTTPSVIVTNRNRRNKKQSVGFKMTPKRFEIIEHYLLEIAKSARSTRKIKKWETLKQFEKWKSKCKAGDESDDEGQSPPIDDDDDDDSEFLSAFEIACLKSISKIDKSKSPITFQSANVSGESDVRLVHEDEIKKKVHKQYLTCLEEMDQQFSKIMDIISTQISLIDILKSHAKVAVKYGYCRPMIDPAYKDTSLDKVCPSGNTPTAGSYICAKALRHPIIEQINKRHKYIPNDIEIGKDNCKGLILHGTNDAGKSSLMKAIGLSLLQAQAGGFVPAQEYKFIPFHNILTRLSGTDNMYKNQGSFAVEASELRDISERCNPRSLVLADELCRGTEHASAIGIVAGGIIDMDKSNTNFVLATHLHDLYKLPEIQQLQTRIQIKHLRVERDPVTNLLTYVRTLQDGPGSAYYGIEVARAQGVKESILTIAESIRKRYIDMSEHLVMDNRSHFNRKKYIPYWCEVCSNRQAEHIHHMAEQNTADENGMINNEFHKNDLFNLVGLCHTCHDDIHIRKTLLLDGYRDTSEGSTLVWSRVDPPPSAATTVEVVTTVAKRLLAGNGDDDDEIIDRPVPKKKKKKINEIY